MDVTRESVADEIRRAASLMRERAEEATPGPWQHMCLGSEGCLVLRESGTVRDRGRGRVARFGQKEWKADHADAGFVAAMSPPVALLVADWLLAAVNGEPGSGFPLKVARAYLAEAAQAEGTGCAGRHVPPSPGDPAESAYLARRAACRKCGEPGLVPSPAILGLWLSDRQGVGRGLCPDGEMHQAGSIAEGNGDD